MKIETYIEKTLLTWKDQGHEQNVKHYLLGLIDEIGELAGACKKKEGYGLNIDVANVKEELGDLSYFLTRLVDEQFNNELRTNVLLNINDIISNKRKIDYSQFKNKPLFFLITELDRYKTNIVTYLSTTVNTKEALQHLVDSVLNIYYTISIIAYKCDSSLEKIFKANITKLEKRWKDKTAKEVGQESHRDREEEKKAVEKNS